MNSLDNMKKKKPGNALGDRGTQGINTAKSEQSREQHATRQHFVHGQGKVWKKSWRTEKHFDPPRSGFKWGKIVGNSSPR